MNAAIEVGSLSKMFGRFKALDEVSLRVESGQPARLERYRENCAALVSGMRALGLRSFLADGVQAPIIVTFHAPRDSAYDFKRFYRCVRARGFILYPGKLTALETFRVGCIGAIDAAVLRGAVAAIGEALAAIGVTDFSAREVEAAHG